MKQIMSCESDVLKIGKKLDEIVKNENSDQNPLDLLNLLNSLPITLEILQKTRIGMTVNSLRKHTTHENIANLAKFLIKKWKKLLTEQNISKDNKNQIKKLNIENDKHLNYEVQTCIPQTLSQMSSEISPSNSQDSINFEITNDPIRIKCHELLINALTYADMPSGPLDPKQIAIRVEETIFKEFSNTDFKYKSRIRSKVANLKDSKNPRLRENVLLGHITPERLATMTTEEMASDEMKILRQKYTKDSINDHQMSITTGTPTDLFKCGKCKGKKCTYSQIQTRSSDEPMTTFVYCIDCGNRWKFC
ncbi:transcription elongation factor A protein 1-like isoform X2 [Gordionus sp. m RMFG-2023]|uniref:transcription elongation factor A protein 1-like isoform X2 n=1 Tax=Gordionus sp. m RMFG-2023 TaxID=3053472 RepID=UPI0031FDEA17